jgi:hypothetical protein
MYTAYCGSPKRPGRVWVLHRHLFIGYRDSFLGVKRAEREADHSPPSTSKVKNVWNYTSIPIPYSVYLHNAEIRKEMHKLLLYNTLMHFGKTRVYFYILTA